MTAETKISVLGFASDQGKEFNPQFEMRVKPPPSDCNRDESRTNVTVRVLKWMGRRGK
jgi:hypothetical protein